MRILTTEAQWREANDDGEPHIMIQHRKMFMVLPAHDATVIMPFMTRDEMKKAWEVLHLTLKLMGLA